MKVARRGQWMPAAWSLYKFSLLYLALLFAAMVADRLLAR
jgi:heme O synthase-like polyprenyltransferase